MPKVDRRRIVDAQREMEELASVAAKELKAHGASPTACGEQHVLDLVSCAFFWIPGTRDPGSTGRSRTPWQNCAPEPRAASDGETPAGS